MEFRTKTKLIEYEIKISHLDKVFFIGSCFSQNISKKLQSLKYKIITNPTGILYNPESINNSLNIVMENYNFTQSDLNKKGDLWFSYNHHSEFSSVSKDEILKNINTRKSESHSFLKTCNYLIITFGTAKVYKLNENGSIVANCHKMPSDRFVNSILNVREIIEKYNLLIKKLKLFNPDLKIIFTVSPVRHIKDGLHINNLSKATLLLAIDEIVNVNKDCFYFPSYEIVIDDLRDYRFYNDDLVHPNDFAINYIFDKFCESFFSNETKNINKSISDINNMLSHRPFNTQTDDYKKFLQKLNNKLADFCKKNPQIDFTEEQKIIEDKLSMLKN